jgi:hypothetical protein
MSYQKAMEAAGATVLDFESFGSYQGEWWARVRHEGSEFWVNGSYGSCSGCDAFESEFGYGSHHYHGGRYVDEPETPDTCEDCAALQRKLADFGRTYLDQRLTQAEAEAGAAKYASWDHEAPAMVAWIQAHPIGSAA